MTSLMGQHGYFPNYQNKFSPIPQQKTAYTLRPITPGLKPIPVQPPIDTPSTQQSVKKPLSQPIPSKQTPVSQSKAPISSAPESSNLWQQQAEALIKQYGPSLMRQFGPPLARKVALPLAQQVGPPLARKVGIPLARRIGSPILRKVFLPLAKRAGFALIRRLGFPF